MKNLRIINFSFDKKIRVIIAICTLIALSIIGYCLYNLILNNNTAFYVVELSDFGNITKYSANYTVIVNSNKNTNEYNVCETADLLEDKYSFSIDNSLNINITSENINISKKNIAYEYTTGILDLEYNNYIAFSTIIKLIQKINNQEISANITKLEENDNITYDIKFDEEYIKKINELKVIISKSLSQITEIRMYDDQANEKYDIILNTLVV